MKKKHSPTNEPDHQMIETELFDGLHALGKLVPPEPPCLQHFEQLVEVTKRVEGERRRRGLWLFVCTAVVIAAGWVVSMTIDPKLFLFIVSSVSVLSVVALPIGFAIYRFRGASTP